MFPTFVIVMGACLMLILLLSQHPGLGRREAEAEDDGDSFVTMKERVQRLISKINYGGREVAEQASRRLLSMGPGILPVIFDRLMLLEENPHTLSPSSQLELEGLLSDYGLVAFLQLSGEMGLVHRASPISPAVLRVLEVVGPHVILEVARMGTLDPSWDVTSLVLRFGERADERLLEVVTSGGGKEVEHLLNAILILVGRKPRLLAEMVEGCESRDGEAIAVACFTLVLCADGLRVSLEQPGDGRRRSRRTRSLESGVRGRCAGVVQDPQGGVGGGALLRRPAPGRLGRDPID